MGDSPFRLLDRVPQPLFFLDGSFCISYANEAWVSLTGMSPESVIGRPFAGLFPGMEGVSLEEKALFLERGELPELLFEMPVPSPGGEERWVFVRLVSSGCCVEGMAFAGGFQDISEWKAAEKRKERLLKELAASNKELKEFAYIVSHDLKAPLRAISSLAGWLKDDFGESLGEEGKGNLDLLVDRVRKMYALIEGILRYSRLGSLREERAEVDVDGLISDTLKMLCPAEGIRVVRETPFPVISCERTRLAEVFLNLVGNAVKAVDREKGEIRIGAAREGNSWRFWVGDNGRGIPKEHQERIFKLFQKVRPEDEGTGIGLTLVKKVVEMYGGEVEVESSPGEGSVFSFTFPESGNVAIGA